MRTAVIIFTILILFIAPFVGFDGFLGIDLNGQDAFIFHNLRLPRVLLAFFVGGGLAIVGWLFQVIFKNALATPYTMGISSIAALAMAVSELLLENSLVANKDLIFVVFYIPILILILIGFKRNIARERLLLFGVCLGIFASSAIVFLQTILGNESVSKLVRWMMGGLEIVGYQDLFYIIPSILISVMVMIYYRKEITMISIGEEFASSRGVDIPKIFFIQILISNILVALIVWYCGPIGFVGLIIPHLTKKLLGHDFSKNITLCFMLGGGFLVFCDLISRSVSASHVIPVGAITACIGAPLLILQLIKRN
ncbi:iron ABC transporter permease [Bacteriovorax sp. DB6_IX]|uniref:FecCD family ABC transporter permease n=1 Tax=Bacteriovorax sp. DB6_IX TaxID=1353530 RepID=UPI00038A17E0|nr:iron ABC transporter permease [Bacteriovorax sp. DB6_IX]EQC49636.1 iron chelate uptake ABC transporter, FeCT family, permease protein [Bacteriovorax sp. DB6_IX]